VVKVMAATAVAAAITGCGLGAGAATGGVRLDVTDDFGVRSLGESVVESAPGSETAMRQLERKHRVETRYGGRYVQSIDGLAGGTAAGRPVDWFYFVNGAEATVGASDVTLKAGDSVWWDRRDWGAATHVSAVVGQWPEPFASSDGSGKRVEVECVDPAEAGGACAAARTALERTGARVLAASAAHGRRPTTPRMLVGDWRTLRRDPDVRQIELGPSVSGVYAIPSADGKSIALLGRDARVHRQLGAGTGLIAALANSKGGVTWVVTGVGKKGLEAAVSCLSEKNLNHKFAAVTNADGTVEPAPAISK